MCLSELKPCPFCGSENIGMHASYNPKIHRYFMFARCEKCKSTGTSVACKREYDSTDESIWEDYAAYIATNAWNRRIS